MRVNRSFIRNARGNVAVLFAFAALPMAATMGGVVDYTYYLKTKAEVQSALDNGLLGAVASVEYTPSLQTTSRELGTYREKLQERVSQWVKTSLKKWDPKRVSLSKVRVTLGKDGEVNAWASATVNTTFLRLLTINKMNLQVYAQAKREFAGATEVVLVLDNTGSMQGSKLAELKRASKQFIDVLNQEVTKSRGQATFKVGIVPFTQYVNVGTQYRNASWINVPADRIVRRHSCWWSRPCLRYGYRKRCWWTGGGDRGGRRRIICGRVRYCRQYGPRYRRCSTWYRRSYWKGCVGSRGYPRNLTDSQYKLERVPGVLSYSRSWRYNYCPSARITPLMKLNRTGVRLLKRQIDRMNASGSTYIPAGLAWGMRVLSPQQPFSQGARYDEVAKNNVQKVIVLMTDGQNTVSPTYPEHDGYNRTLSDRLTRELCKKIKAKNPATGKPYAEIITVSFDVHDPAVKDMLQDCASLGSFDAKSGGLVKVFKNIGMKLTKLHLSR